MFLFVRPQKEHCLECSSNFSESFIAYNAANSDGVMWRSFCGFFAKGVTRYGVRCFAWLYGGYGLLAYLTPEEIKLCASLNAQISGFVEPERGTLVDCFLTQRPKRAHHFVAESVAG